MHAAYYGPGRVQITLNVWSPKLLMLSIFLLIINLITFLCSETWKSQNVESSMRVKCVFLLSVQSCQIFGQNEQFPGDGRGDSFIIWTEQFPWRHFFAKWVFLGKMVTIQFFTTIACIIKFVSFSFCENSKFKDFYIRHALKINDFQNAKLLIFKWFSWYHCAEICKKLTYHSF